MQLKYLENIKSCLIVTFKRLQSVYQTFIGLIWFYGISIMTGYLMWNPVFTYILNIWFVNTYCQYNPLNDQFYI